MKLSEIFNLPLSCEAMPKRKTNLLHEIRDSEGVLIVMGMSEEESQAIVDTINKSGEEL